MATGSFKENLRSFPAQKDADVECVLYAHEDNSKGIFSFVFFSTVRSRIYWSFGWSFGKPSSGACPTCAQMLSIGPQQKGSEYVVDNAKLREPRG